MTKLPTVSSMDVSDRVKRLNEKLHTPFENEKRWHIIQEAFEEYKRDVAKYLQDRYDSLTLDTVIDLVEWVEDFKDGGYCCPTCTDNVKGGIICENTNCECHK